MRETPACAAHRIAKTTHLALALAGRLVAVLGAIVHACSRFDQHVMITRTLSMHLNSG